MRHPFISITAAPQQRLPIGGDFRRYFFCVVVHGWGQLGGTKKRGTRKEEDKKQEQDKGFFLILFAFGRRLSRLSFSYIIVMAQLSDLSPEIVLDIARLSDWNLEFRYTCKFINGLYQGAMVRYQTCLLQFYRDCSEKWGGYEAHDPKEDTPGTEIYRSTLGVRRNPAAILCATVHEDVGQPSLSPWYTGTHGEVSPALNTWKYLQFEFPLRQLGQPYPCDGILGMSLHGPHLDEVGGVMIFLGSTLIHIMEHRVLSALRRRPENEDGLLIFSPGMPLLLFPLCWSRLTVRVFGLNYTVPPKREDLRLTFDSCTIDTSIWTPDLKYFSWHFFCMNTRVMPFPRSPHSWILFFNKGIVPCLTSITFRVRNRGRDLPDVYIPMECAVLTNQAAQSWSAKRLPFPLAPNEDVIVIPGPTSAVFYQAFKSTSRLNFRVEYDYVDGDGISHAAHLPEDAVYFTCLSLFDCDGGWYTIEPMDRQAGIHRRPQGFFPGRSIYDWEY